MLLLFFRCDLSSLSLHWTPTWRWWYHGVSGILLAERMLLSMQRSMIFLYRSQRNPFIAVTATSGILAMRLQSISFLFSHSVFIYTLLFYWCYLYMCIKYQHTVCLLKHDKHHFCFNVLISRVPQTGPLIFVEIRGDTLKHFQWSSLNSHFAGLYAKLSVYLLYEQN